jgi:hypothetical protein
MARSKLVPPGPRKQRTIERDDADMYDADRKRLPRPVDLYQLDTACMLDRRCRRRIE